MARVALPIVGAVIGAWVGGPQGAQIGWAVGSVIAGVAFQETQKFQGPRLEDLKFLSSAYGSVLPWVEGSPRLAGSIVWNSDKREIETTTEEGGKGGPSVESTTYTYEIDLLVQLSCNPIVGVRRIWMDGALVWTQADNASVTDVVSAGRFARAVRVYTGAEDQLPDPAYEEAVGAGNAPAYRGAGTVFLEGLDLGGSGQIRNLTFEVVASGQVSHVMELAYEVEATGRVDDAGVFAEGGNAVHEAQGILFRKTYGFGEAPQEGLVNVVETQRDGRSRVVGQLQAQRLSSQIAVTSDRSVMVEHSGREIYAYDGTGATLYVPAGTDEEYEDSNPIFLRTGDHVFISHTSTVEEASILGHAPGAAHEFTVNNAQNFSVGEAVYLEGVTGTAAGLLNGYRTVFAKNGNTLTVAVNTAGLTASGGRLFEAMQVSISHFPVAGGGAQSTLNALPMGVKSMAFTGSKLYALRSDYRRIYQFSYPALALEQVFDPPSLDGSMQALMADAGSLYGLHLNTDALYKRSGSTWQFDRAGLGPVTVDTDYPQAAYMKDGVVYFSRINNNLNPRKFEAFYGVKKLANTPAPLADVVRRLCLRAGLQESDIDVTGLTSITAPVEGVRGLAISQVTSARTILDTLGQAYFFEAIEEGTIKFVPRGGAVAATIPWEQMGAGDSTEPAENPLPVKVADDLELPAQISVRYANVDNDYQDGSEQSDRVGTRSTSTPAAQYPLGFKPVEARRIADALVLDAVMGGSSFGPFSIQRRFAPGLQPTDVVQLQDPVGATHRARITKIDTADGVLTIEAVRDDPTIRNSAVDTDLGYSSSTTITTPGGLPASPTDFALMDLPPLRDQDTGLGLYWAATGFGPNWGGTALFRSKAPAGNYDRVATLPERATMGRILTSPAAFPYEGVFDEITRLEVEVYSGELASTTREGVLDLQENAAAIGYWERNENSGVVRFNVWEVLQFRSAELTAPGRYTLSGLLRYQMGSDWSRDLITAHGLAYFVLLNRRGMRRIDMQASDIGQWRYFRAPALGQTLQEAYTAPLKYEAMGVKPFAPVAVRGDRTTGDLRITWDRRSRASASPLSLPLPLGEPGESYLVEILGSGGSVVRELTSSVPEVTYTSVQQQADFQVVPATFTVRVYQTSTYGRGHPRQAVL